MDRRLRGSSEMAGEQCIGMMPRTPLSFTDTQPEAVSPAGQSHGWGGEIRYGNPRRTSFADTAQLAVALAMVAVLAGAICLSELDSVYWTHTRITAAVQRVLGIRWPVEDGAGLAPGARRVVVVAENDESQRLIAKTTLEHYGYAVALADNAAQAEALLRKAGPRVALVLLDREEQRTAAGETIRRLKSIRPNVRILISQAVDEGSSAVSGGVGLIEKPFSAVPLAEAVRKVLASN